MTQIIFTVDNKSHKI